MDLNFKVNQMKQNILYIILLLTAISCGENGGNAPSVAGITSSLSLYVTASNVLGNLGGPTGADSICMSDANYPGSGTFKAMLSDGSSRIACTTANCSGGSSEHVGWVLNSNTEYTRTDGTIIGRTDSNGLFVFPLTASFASTAPSLNSIHTGLNSSWTSKTENCYGWTQTVGPGPAEAFSSGGAYDATSTSALTGGAGPYCDNTAGVFTYRLLCVEQ
jgi:hypothetical protein